MASYVLVTAAILAGFMVGRRNLEASAIALVSVAFVAISFMGIVAGWWPLKTGALTAFATCCLSQIFYVLGARIRN